MRNIFLLSFVLAMIPFTFVKPHVGILLWSWVSYMNPHRMSWGFIYDYRLAMLIGAATILAWLVSREPKVPPRDPITALIVIISVWVSITTIFALVPAEAYVVWNQKIKILIMTVLAIMLVRTRERLHALIWVIVVSIGFFGAKGGLFTLLGGAENLVLGPPNTFLGDNNSLSLAIIMIVPLMRYLQLQSVFPWIRLAFYPAILLSLLAIIGSYSRGALLGMGAMLLVLAVKSQRRGLIVGCALIAAVFAFAFTPQHWVDRMMTIAEFEQDKSAQGRFDAWTFAFKLSLDRPVVGGGFSIDADDDLFFSYVPDARLARSFHSIFFEMLGEHGWVGLALYLALMLAGLSLSRTIEHRARGRPDLGWARDLAAMAQVSMAGFVAAGIFQDHAFFDLYLHVLVMLAVTHGIVRNETATARAPAGLAYRGTFEAAEPMTEGALRPGEGPSRGR